ncbi:MAG: hypothetical protein AAFR88_05365 [Pseudomonadota bacterium]
MKEGTHVISSDRGRVLLIKADPLGARLTLKALEGDTSLYLSNSDLDTLKGLLS